MAKLPSPPEIARIIEYFEHLNPQSLNALDEIYTTDAYFKDPFNEVRGIDHIRAVFAHMFVALNEPRFVVRDVVREGQNCWMTWDFIFRFKRWQSDLQTIRGATHFHWNEQGKIISHRDYWDAAEELYEKLPFIGILMRWLKRRANT
ncbi:MAG: nuclear transport factor 2 family protein [Burkholderiales bacterium]|jgi:hypothetical protein